MKAHQTLILRISRLFRLAVTLFLPALVVSLIACTAHAVSYTFTNIADSNGIFAPTEPMSGIGNGVLSINNSGMVAFGSGLDDGSFGVFEGNGGPITPIALTTGPTFSLVGGGWINSAGTVGFFGSFKAGGQGVFTWKDGITSTVVTTSDGFTSVGGGLITDAGRVLFGANGAGGSTGLVLRGGGQPPATVVVTSGSVFSDVIGASINGLGTVAFSAILDSGATGVFTGNGGATTTIGLVPFPQGMAPSINDSGTVVFAADSGSSVGRRILMGNGGLLTTFVSASGPFSGFGIYPAINNGGTVAFLAGLDVINFEVREGLFTGPDPVADKVLISNDLLFGSRFVQFGGGTTQSLGALAINDFGQIAFHYQLADGRQGIAVATPTPEPTVTSMILIGVALLGYRRRVRAKDQFNHN